MNILVSQQKKVAKGSKKVKKISITYLLHLADDKMSYFQASLQEFPWLSCPVIDSANFNASLHSVDLK